MVRYTYSQLEELWIQAGGPRALAPLMAAIALAESAGDPGAENKTDNNGTQTSWGLWQISDGTHNQPAPDILTPLGNARAAVAKYNTQGLGAWGTYTSGAYKTYYNDKTQPSSLPQGGTQPGAIETTAWWDPTAPGGFLWQVVHGVQSLWDASGNVAPGGNPVAVIATGFGLLLKSVEWLFVPSHWVRIITGAFGIMFLIPGLYALMRSAQGGYGDVTLALGILLVTISGMLLFVTFHNLPTDVTNLRQLIIWINASIRQGRPAAETAHTQTV